MNNYVRDSIGTFALAFLGCATVLFMRGSLLGCCLRLRPVGFAMAWTAL
ncbi:hypothetical protein QN224_29045 [Sinorhizobium sp. 8-89]|nr:hypothetical protein [Sinorhizobium sp. 7-81]MDK1389441.1 hypothetical protein [Sinorhizobium sp. 7-81]